jgi:hypothetical protein
MALLDEGTVAHRVLLAVLSEPSEFDLDRLQHRVERGGCGLTKREAQKAMKALRRARWLEPKGFRAWSPRPPHEGWAGELAVEVWTALVQKGPMTRAQLAQALDVGEREGNFRRAIANLKVCGAISPPSDLIPSRKALLLYGPDVPGALGPAHGPAMQLDAEDIAA